VAAIAHDPGSTVITNQGLDRPKLLVVLIDIDSAYPNCHSSASRCDPDADQLYGLGPRPSYGYARYGGPDHGARSRRSERRRTGFQGGARGGDVVDDQNRPAREAGSKPFKRAVDVLLAPEAVVTDLGRCGPYPYRPSRRRSEPHAGRPLAHRARGVDLRPTSAAQRLAQMANARAAAGAQP